LPEIVKILCSTTFKYNKNLTTLALGELETIVRGAIVNFDNTNLNNFDSIFRHSNLLKAIDESENSILSNTTNIRLSKKKTLNLNKKEGHVIKFGNAFYNPHSGHNAEGGGILQSTGFKIQGDALNTHYYDDDGKGNLRRYILSDGVRVIKNSTAGTIDYTAGQISIDAETFTSTVNNDTSIEFTIVPSSNDVIAIRGSLIDIDVDRIKVTGEVDTIASGEASAGVGYTSTSTSNY